MIHPRHALARQSYPHHTGEHLSMLLFDFHTKLHQARPHLGLPKPSEPNPTGGLYILIYGTSTA